MTRMRLFIQGSSLQRSVSHCEAEDSDKLRLPNGGGANRQGTLMQSAQRRQERDALAAASFKYHIIKVVKRLVCDLWIGVYSWLVPAS